MELELLDQILASDEPLRLALLVFDAENNPSNLERARRVIQIQAKEGLLQVLFKGDSEERLLEGWEIREVLGDIENWIAPCKEARYFLRITDKGAEFI